jgi:hypothetical protein
MHQRSLADEWTSFVMGQAKRRRQVQRDSHLSERTYDELRK